MSIIDQLKSYLSKQGSAIKSVTDYFDPTSNKGNNFWSTPIAKNLANTQQAIQQAPQNLTSAFPHLVQNVGNQKIPLPLAPTIQPKVKDIYNFVAPTWQMPLRAYAQIKQTPVLQDFLMGPNLPNKKLDLGTGGKALFGDEALQSYTQRYKKGYEIPMLGNIKGPASLPLFGLGIVASLFPQFTAEDKLAAQETINLVKKASTVEDLTAGLDKASPKIKTYVQNIFKDKKIPINTAEDLFNAVKKPEVSDVGKFFDQLPTLRQTGKNQYTNVRKIDNRLVNASEPLPWEQGAKTGTNIVSDIATQRKAEAETLINNLGKGGFKGLSPETVSAFQDWVNSRSASRVEGLLKKQEFKSLDAKGIQGLLDFQAGNKSGVFADVAKFFDSKFKQLQDAGIDFNYKQDYLPQLWSNTQHEIDQVFPRSLGTRPSFTLHALIKNYKEGIDAGLKPKFSSVSELAGWYEQRANKALADKKFFDWLAHDGFIQTSNDAMKGWSTLDPDRFPKVSAVVNGENYTGAYKAPPELAIIINNYLRDAQFPLLENIANYVSRAKNVTLSFGIPNTAINAHGINILARHTLFGQGGNPISRFLTGTKFLLSPNAAMASLEKDLASAVPAVKNGLTLSTEDHSALFNEVETLATALGKKWNTVFERPLFNKMLPALKLSSYNALVKEGMDGKSAAKLVNNLYGGINWQQMGRSRDFQNLLRSIILAPDWAETSVRLGGNMLKAANPLVKDATAAKYRVMMTTFVGSYVALNITNKLTSGHYAYENTPGHTFELEVGQSSNGQIRYIRPYGTAVDMIRLPFDTIAGLLKGDPSPFFRAFSNRFSIPLSSAMHLATNQDYKGQRLYGKNIYGQPISATQAAGGIGSEALGLIGFPSFAKNFIDSATGKQGIEAGLTQGFELPFRYSSAANKTDTTFNMLSSLKTNEEKRAKWNELVSNGTITKDNVAAIKQKISDDKLGLSYDETRLRSLPVMDGTRASKIFEELNKLSTPEEKRTLWNKYVQSRVITSQVARQLKTLIGKQ